MVFGIFGVYWRVIGGSRFRHRRGVFIGRASGSWLPYYRSRLELDPAPAN